MDNWQKIFSDGRQHRAEIVLAVLADSGLRPVIVNKQDAAYRFGQYEVHVPADDVIRAIKIIKDDIQFE